MVNLVNLAKRRSCFGGKSGKSGKSGKNDEAVLEVNLGYDKGKSGKSRLIDDSVVNWDTVNRTTLIWNRLGNHCTVMHVHIYRCSYI